MKYFYVCTYPSDKSQLAFIHFSTDVRNAFRLKYDTDEWILACPSHDTKFEFITTLQSAMATAIQDLN